MAKVQPQYALQSYGIYKGWQDNGKTLPKLSHTTLNIPAEVETEFGLILLVQKAKGAELNWTIQHPNIADQKGRVMPPFAGEIKVRNNHWLFYLGDTIWLPEHDKVGDWRMLIEFDGKVLVEKTFNVTLNCLEAEAESRFWKRRGF